MSRLLTRLTSQHRHPTTLQAKRTVYGDRTTPSIGGRVLSW
jgi:hypothetical protein